MSEGIMRRIASGEKFDVNDHFIAVMGLTGSGKSTFISRATGKEVKTSRGLESCTTDINAYDMMYGNERVWLLDTPGFNDTWRTDTQILKEITGWLAIAYENKIKLSGLIYLHRITDIRMDGAANKNLRAFRKLCGDDNLDSVMLVTTMWKNVSEEDGNFRENELRSNPKFWGQMSALGSQIRRHTDDHNSAMNIVGCLMDKKTKVVLTIQKEMAKGLKLEETEAGKELFKELEAQRKMWQEEIQKTQEETRLALQNAEKAGREEIEDLLEEQKIYQEKLDQALKERDDLDVNVKKLLQNQAEKFNQEIEALQIVGRNSESRLSTTNTNTQGKTEQPPDNVYVPQSSVQFGIGPNGPTVQYQPNSDHRKTQMAMMGMALAVDVLLNPVVMSNCVVM